VDDDDPVRAVTASMLIDLGYRVLDVGSGEAAMAILVENSKIDILMTDLVMSGMNGVQLAAAARAARPHLSVIFISGYADQAGATISASDQLLRKPFGAIDLHRVVEAELLERRDALARA
jgi:CheY-like chemotaxis protein